MYRAIATVSVVILVALAGCGGPGPGAETTADDGLDGEGADGGVGDTPDEGDDMIGDETETEGDDMIGDETETDGMVGNETTTTEGDALALSG